MLASAAPSISWSCLAYGASWAAHFFAISKSSWVLPRLSIPLVPNAGQNFLGNNGIGFSKMRCEKRNSVQIQHGHTILLLGRLKTSLDSFPGQFRAVRAAANQIVRNLEVDDVALFSPDAVGNVLGKLLGIPHLTAPFRQQVVSEYAGIVVIARLKLKCFVEQSTGTSRVPSLVLGYKQHAAVPL